MDRKTVKDWQKDHNKIVADKVQVWSPRGIMLTDCMSKANARILVKNGFCYVVDQQTIRQYDKRGKKYGIYSIFRTSPGEIPVQRY